MGEWQNTEYRKASSDWKAITLGEMSEKITDGAHQSPKPQAGGKYMCSVKDMTYDKFDFNGCKLISEEDYENLVKQGCQPKKGDLLISKDGANCLDLIFIFRQDEELVLLSSIAIARLLPEYVPEYVRYFLLSPDCQYTMRNNYVSGSAIPRVVLKDFKKVPILVPEYAEQKAIASVLSSLDDKIDLLHRQNKTLEAMAETLFRQWFVEEAQEDWEEKPISFFGEVVCGKTPSKKVHNYFDGDVPFIKIPDMHGNTFIFNTTDSLTGVLSQRNKTLPPKSICVSCIATVGLVSMNAKESQTNQQINSVIPKKEYYRYFLYLTMMSYYDHLHSMASGGTATLNLNTSNFSNIPIIYPGEELLIGFDKEIKPCFEKIFENQI
jgi:type I restriction enzyme S subunit